MNEQAKKPKRPMPRWLKVSLRTSLLVVAVLCVGLGFLVNRVNKQKRAVEWVREHGGTVFYEFEGDGESRWRVKNPKQPGPEWLRKLIGIDYFANVGYVDLSDADIDDIAPLAKLTELTNLRLGNTSVSDLSPLAEMKKMRWLYLENTPVSDLSALAEMKDMQGLALEGTQATDLSPLLNMNDAIIWLNDDQPAEIPPELKPRVRRQR